jgi:hypothetical protein
LTVATLLRLSVALGVELEIVLRRRDAVAAGIGEVAASRVEG